MKNFFSRSLTHSLSRQSLSLVDYINISVIVITTSKTNTVDFTVHGELRLSWTCGRRPQVAERSTGAFVVVANSSLSLSLTSAYFPLHSSLVHYRKANKKQVTDLQNYTHHTLTREAYFVTKNTHTPTTVHHKSEHSSSATDLIHD